MTFEEYVLTRGPALLRLARLLVDDVHRADDLVQDTLVRVYPRWAKILRTDQPDLYVRRVLVNVNASWWRRRSSREVPAVFDVDVWPGAGDHGAPVAERVALWDKVRALPGKQRAVIALRYYEDLDDDRIAQILGCSRATVRTHAMRALAAMRVELHELEGTSR
ncbi:SigE family RNA polymerase sigma factor [Dactylosporangium sp. CS-047395]|uniref:SigE family RNA polymerase sigma factor n=1 Tax=Dactylosporangium sp. CS-047395 TaxID=3239936 RepID=UPI003D8A31C0